MDALLHFCALVLVLQSKRLVLDSLPHTRHEKLIFLHTHYKLRHASMIGQCIASANMQAMIAVIVERCMA